VLSTFGDEGHPGDHLSVQDHLQILLLPFGRRSILKSASA